MKVLGAPVNAWINLVTGVSTNPNWSTVALRYHHFNAKAAARSSTPRMMVFRLSVGIGALA